MRRPLLSLPFVLAIAACGGTASSTPEAGMSTCAGETRAMTYAAGMSTPGAAGRYNVQLVLSKPGPPQKGNNAWTVRVTDATTAAAVDNLKLSVVPFMPDHGHGTPITVNVTPMSGGTYGLDPLNLFMSGLWKIPVDLTDIADSTKKDLATFYFCIEG